MGIWQESGTTSKTKSKSVSVRHGCQGLKGCPLTTQWHGDCSHSSMPRLLGWVYTTPAFWPGIPWKNEFPPQCTTMLREARARVRACCDVNLMTSCCSDGRSKRLNKGIVFSPLCRKGAPLPVLLLSSGHQTVKPLWVQWSTTQLHKIKKQQKIPSSSHVPI